MTMSPLANDVGTLYIGFGRLNSISFTQQAIYTPFFVGLHIKDCITVSPYRVYNITEN